MNRMKTYWAVETYQRICDAWGSQHLILYKNPAGPSCKFDFIFSLPLVHLGFPESAGLELFVAGSNWIPGELIIDLLKPM